MAFAGAKTTVYEGGLLCPCLVRNPYASKMGVVSNAMISWTDITPTVFDLARVLDKETDEVKSSLLSTLGSEPVTQQNNDDITPGRFHGRSFLGILEDESPSGWDETFASHTFHEIQMYYPMRVIRERQYKLIWNIAYPLLFPFASDLWISKTWQSQLAEGPPTAYGAKTVDSYVHRPEFELYDLLDDPHEGTNLAASSRCRPVLDRMKVKLKTYQEQTQDPWIMKSTMNSISS